MNLLYFIALLGILLFIACATEPSGAPQAGLVGKWACVSAVVDGKPLPDDTVRLLRLSLTSDRYKTEKGAEVLFDSTYSVDRSKTPKEINMIGTEGALAGKEAQGIYALDGDTLHICYTMPGERRPTAFESAAGSKAFLVQWKRL